MVRSEFIQNFCQQVVREENVKSMKNSCLEWIEIACGVCLNNYFTETAKSSRLWSWLLTWVHLDKKSKAIDVDFADFSRKPSNLTMTECSELMQTIYKNFLSIYFVEDDNGFAIEEFRESPEINKLWVLDFIVMINIFLLIASIVVMAIFNQELSDLIYGEINGEPIIPNVQEEDSEPNSEDEDNPIKQEVNPTPAEANEDIPLAEPQVSLQTDQIPISREGSEILDEVSAPEFDQSDDEISQPEEEEFEVLSNDKTLMQDGDSSTASSIATEIVNSLTKKPSKNFVNINIEKFKQKYNTPNTLSTSAEEKALKKSLIPVRKASSRLSTPLLKKPSSSSC